MRLPGAVGAATRMMAAKEHKKRRGGTPLEPQTADGGFSATSGHRVDGLTLFAHSGISPNVAVIMDAMNDDYTPSSSSGWFNTTHWTVILNAKSDDTTEARDALSRLCQTYWSPIRTYISRVERNPAEVQDLTQEFFARFLEKMQFQLADPERGRFRSFLLTCVKHFLVNERERASARKRGGGQEFISLDEEATESGEPRFELRDERTAAHAYEETWALTLLAQVRSRLEAEYAQGGRTERFALLEQFLPGAEPQMTYGEAAERLGAPEGTVKSDVYRLKRRYREVLREEIAHTVATEAEVDDELRYLVGVLARRSA